MSETLAYEVLAWGLPLHPQLLQALVEALAATGCSSTSPLETLPAAPCRCWARTPTLRDTDASIFGGMQKKKKKKVHLVTSEAAPIGRHANGAAATAHAAHTRKSAIRAPQRNF